MFFPRLILFFQMISNIWPVLTERCIKLTSVLLIHNRRSLSHWRTIVSARWGSLNCPCVGQSVTNCSVGAHINIEL